MARHTEYIADLRAQRAAVEKAGPEICGLADAAEHEIIMRMPAGIDRGERDHVRMKIAEAKLWALEANVRRLHALDAQIEVLEEDDARDTVTP